MKKLLIVLLLFTSALLGWEKQEEVFIPNKLESYFGVTEEVDCSDITKDWGAGCFHKCRRRDNCGGDHYYYCCNICDYWEDEGCEYAPHF